ncbi:allantoate amidohydrolase [Azospirillum doebereinerae]|uniref:Allantoate amidohydrolase n=1 Tax=Azospirillum doebereinerae TaxID=92933 RepID=A0A3S0XIW0_9PROT|nr:allantoate amidohydrolase [Azospirillum doebereinerae]MCG5238666.1 allantoate amidohydrolase [Azospirillum doebereinerae]RUQ63913.1 allantoate amidohydrolase [Azospirillum doebereinerae]
MPDSPLSGPALLARIDALAAISAEPGRLSRLYLTPEHRRANDLVAVWMREAGMAVREDGVGNIVGRYEGDRPGLPALLIGSHLDTVRDAGRYDGMLGVLSGIAVVAELHAQGRRLPFAVEVIGFGDEEGTRFQSTLIGSRAIAGAFDPAVLDKRDADGVRLGDALAAFGKDPAAWATAAYDPVTVLAYAELHIEQGPVLESLDRAVGVVSAIAGATRLAVTVDGFAGHAGTVPMTLRRDALAAAAEMILAVETLCSGAERLVGTVGRIEAAPGATNVIPGRVRFTIDLRADRDALRLERVAAVRAGLAEIAARRNVGIAFETLHESPAVACHPALMAQFAAAATALGLDAPELPSGAGHDAMAVAGLTDIAMLFVRCDRGISHNPAESITAADAEAGARVLARFVDHFQPASDRAP